MKFKSFLIFIFSIFFAFPVLAEEGFDLVKRKDHYHFDAEINGQNVENILLESGAMGFHIRKKDYQKLFEGCNFEKSRLEIPQINMLGKAYDVENIFWAEFNIGCAHYRGNIFVMENSFPEKAIVNLHYLTNAVDSTKNIIKLNFSEKKVRFVDISEVDTTNLYHFDMVEFRPKPVAETKITIEQHGKKYSLKGKFIVDFGADTHFKMLDNKIVASFCKKSGIELMSSTDVMGRPSAKFECDKLTIGDKTYKALTIGFHRSNINAMGLIGTYFFEEDIYIDTKGNRIYYR